MSKIHLHATQIMSLVRSNKLNASKAHSFDFNLYFFDESVAQVAADRLVADGFTANVRPADDELPWRCAANRLVVPTYQVLSDLIDKLEALAAELGGEYDGWGAFLGSDEAANTF